MKTVRIEQFEIVGVEIKQAISKAITRATMQSCRVAFTFNGVEITVDDMSDPDLIYRDWSRAMQGMMEGNKVGPRPGELTAAEIANDARVKTQNDARRAEREEVARRDAEIGRANVDAALLNAPAFSLTDPEGWQRGLDKNTDPYGRCCYDFAEAWGRLMQAEVEKGMNLADVAEDCCSFADKKFGVTGFMYGAAVSILATFWVYGEDLNRWHNAKYGRPDAEGTVNPAILTIVPKVA